jgi:hypothetical protein
VTYDREPRSKLLDPGWHYSAKRRGVLVVTGGNYESIGAAIAAAYKALNECFESCPMCGSRDWGAA